ncbi:uncharacterized protein LOC105629602 [Jatropha curcas]|uniref:uncharacterized protein LOC105629602 n=1 Tax=Jatropha curcas TaxID=180498 RepID=UPI0005FAB381|nr:uncharacterized protein LOC105629602 [Jatropha curcas]
MLVLDSNGVARVDGFAVVAWKVWAARNDFIWNQKPMVTDSVVFAAYECLQDWKSSRMIGNQRGVNGVQAEGRDVSRAGLQFCSRAGHAGSETRMCGEDLSPAVWNGFVDAALFPTLQTSGFGIVFEEKEGGFMHAVSGLFQGLSSACLIEALALRDGLCWVEENLLTDGILFTDYQVIFNALTSGLDDFSEFGCVIKDCQTILARRTNIRVGWIHCQVNMSAPTVARESYRDYLFRVWDVIPECLFPFYQFG